MRKSALGGVAAASLLLSGQALAGISFSFADPAGQQEVMYTAPTAPGESGMLSYDNSVAVDLQVDTASQGVTKVDTDLELAAHIDGHVCTCLNSGNFEVVGRQDGWWYIGRICRHTAIASTAATAATE